MTDPITETDLHAFVDGQLEVTRRIEVEDYLAGHPEVAALVRRTCGPAMLLHSPWAVDCHLVHPSA